MEREWMMDLPAAIPPRDVSTLETRAPCDASPREGGGEPWAAAASPPGGSALELLDDPLDRQPAARRDVPAVVLLQPGHQVRRLTGVVYVGDGEDGASTPVIANDP